MIVTAYANQINEYADLFDQMYRLRARQFWNRRGWRVNVVDRKEIGRFDELNPLYVCTVDSDSQLLASLRLLPSVGPHMLSDVFPEVMNGKPIIRDMRIWESSRFCVDTRAIANFGPEGLHQATHEVLFGLFDLAEREGLTHIVSVYDVFVERILHRAGCKFERLGQPCLYDNHVYTIICALLADYLRCPRRSPRL